MIHKVVVCERCGSRWDLTDAAFDEHSYTENIFERRNFIIRTIEYNRENGHYFENRRIDLCDGCYIRIEKFIMGGEDYDNILEDDIKE